MKLKLLIIFTLVLTFFLFGHSASSFVVRLSESGNLIKWRTDELVIHLDSSLEQIGPVDQVREQIEEAFEVWRVDGELPIHFRFVNDSCQGHGFTADGNNTNCIFAVAAAEAGAGSVGGENDPGGRAYVSYVDDTGEIVDADVAFFYDAGDWTLTGEADKIDFFKVALHEIGHLLGLAHSSFDKAVMYHSMEIGQAWQSGLDEDDINGIRALYDSREQDEYGCSTVPGSTVQGEHGSRFLFLIATVLLLLSASALRARFIRYGRGNR